MNYQLPEADCHNHFTAWPTLIAEYEEEAGKELDEDIKTAHVTNQVTGPLASHLKPSPDITDFEEICELAHTTMLQPRLMETASSLMGSMH